MVFVTVPVAVRVGVFGVVHTSLVMSMAMVVTAMSVPMTVIVSMPAVAVTMVVGIRSGGLGHCDINELLQPQLPVAISISFVYHLLSVIFRELFSGNVAQGHLKLLCLDCTISIAVENLKDRHKMYWVLGILKSAHCVVGVVYLDSA